MLKVPLPTSFVKKTAVTKTSQTQSQIGHGAYSVDIQLKYE